MYLVQAFNTSRLLSWCERAFFRTPYRHGQVTLVRDEPVSFGLRRQDAVVLGVERRSGGAAEQILDETWEGPIYLPARAGKGELFYARLAGRTEVYPWSESGDVLTLNPSLGDIPVAALADSGFCPHQWRIRRHASHARSKTYSRTL
jgi:hypothetical protein